MPSSADLSYVEFHLIGARAPSAPPSMPWAAGGFSPWSPCLPAHPGLFIFTQQPKWPDLNRGQIMPLSRSEHADGLALREGGIWARPFPADPINSPLPPPPAHLPSHTPILASPWACPYLPAPESLPPSLPLPGNLRYWPLLAWRSGPCSKNLLVWNSNPWSVPSPLSCWMCS